MSQWIKLHTEILNDPKLARLTWKDRGIWMMILALAGQLEYRDENDCLTGQLDTLENVAWHLRSRVADIQPTVEKLIQLDMLHRDADGVLYVTHFADRQSADTSTERVRRYRERGKLSAPALHDYGPAETPMKRVETPMKRVETPMKRAETPMKRVETPMKRVETPMKRVETEQNRTESEQNQNRTRIRTTDQNRADIEHTAVVAVDNSVDESVDTVDNSVDEPVETVDNFGDGSVDACDSMVEADGSATDDEGDGVPEGEELPADGVERVRSAVRCVAAAHDINRAQARAQLVALGVDAAMAERLAREHPPEHIQGWCTYARRQSNLTNPAGFVVNRLAQGLSPPQGAGEAKRWYTDEEYARFFVRGG